MNYSLKTNVVTVTETAHTFCDRCERTQPVGDEMINITAGPRETDICLRCIGILATRKISIRLKAPPDPVEALSGTALLRQLSSRSPRLRKGDDK